MNATEANELRCTAHQIIFDLHEANELSQIQLLYMACMLAYKSLNPEQYKKAVVAQFMPTEFPTHVKDHAVS